MKFETTEFHCCPAVSRNSGGKTKEIIIIGIRNFYLWCFKILVVCLGSVTLIIFD